MCSMGQVSQKNHKEAFQKLTTLDTTHTDGPLSDEDIKTGDFTIQELDDILRKFHNNKSAGPDKIPLELN